MTDRKTLLVEQSPLVLTGIDFIRVLDKNFQDRIFVFFIVPADQLNPPLVPPALVSNVGDVAPASLTLSLSAAEGIAIPEILNTTWQRVQGVSGERVVLEIQFGGPGAFTDYELIIDHPQVDHFFAREIFSFQQACPDPFDCEEPDCPDNALPDPQLDYLARDFGSFNRALSDYAAQHYPHWREDTPADLAVMIKELIAYSGDELAYQQDRISRETRFATATQRRSVAALASLVEYRPDPGQAARGEVAIEVIAGTGGGLAEANEVVWSVIAGYDPVPFHVDTATWVHEHWNEIPFHVIDPDEPCLPEGAKRAYLQTGAPSASEIDPTSPLSADEFWIGRRMALTWRPASDAQSEMSAIVTITGVEHFSDALQLTEGAPTPYTCVTWDVALPFSAPMAEMVASVNVVEVVAGREVVEDFRIGSNARFADAHAALAPQLIAEYLQLPRVVEREGPCGPAGSREAIMRYGLRESPDRGLGWDGPETPRIRLQELDPVTGAPDMDAPEWVFFADLIAADDDDRAYTLEPGLWRDVVHHQRPFDVLVFDDYAANEGWSIRFGADAFGQPPPVGSLFRVTYDTGPGLRANLPAGAINRVSDPTGASSAGLAIASAVRNPLAIIDGRDEETPEHIRLHAPVAYQDNPRRAVRPEDYESILGRLEFVQRANAVTRHTGSWPTDFIAVDPFTGVSLSGEQADSIDREIACIKQATRDARRMEADYRDIDLEIRICIAPGFASGDVIDMVVEALVPPGLFDPDNFTFGQALYRSEIEAVVQAVPGVRFVESMRYRLRGYLDWVVFTEPCIELDRNQIFRLMNDPLFPARGTLRVEQIEVTA